jgi:hypothetical protein
VQLGQASLVNPSDALVVVISIMSDFVDVSWEAVIWNEKEIGTKNTDLLSCVLVI